MVLDGTFSNDTNFPGDFFKEASWDVDNDWLFDFTSLGTDANHPASLLLNLSPAQLATFGLTGVGITYVLRLRVVDSTDLFDTSEALLTVRPIPEPGTLLLLGSGVVGLAILGRRRSR